MTEPPTHYDHEWVSGIINERNRYRQALEHIYRQGKGPHVEIAREALNGE
jgi:hypothetical protein